MQNQNLADTAIKIGKGFIGVIYEPTLGVDKGMGIQFLQAWIDGNESGTGWMEGQPWCAAFASFIRWLAGNALGITPTLIKTASSTDMYNFAKANNLLLPSPIVGCTALERGQDGDPSKSHCHTCMVVDISDIANGNFGSLDGNWGGKVGLNTHPVAAYDFVMTC